MKGSPLGISDKNVPPDMSTDISQSQTCDDPGKMNGVCTGIADLDKFTSGMRPGSLIVIASRHLIGKSTIARKIASHVALNIKLPVLMFNMHLSETVATKLESVLFYVVETPSLSIDEVRSRVCDAIAQHGQIGLIVIDYLQLIAPSTQPIALPKTMNMCCHR